MADLRTSVPPQLAQATSTTSIMLDVIVALIPALGMSVYLFGPRVLVLTLISVGACVLSEYLYRRLTHQSNTLRDCSACVTGLLLAMCLPAASPYWVPLLGGVFAIVVVKQVYGGLGKNFMNPALAGRMPSPPPPPWPPCTAADCPSWTWGRCCWASTADPSGRYLSLCCCWAACT